MDEIATWREQDDVRLAPVVMTVALLSAASVVISLLKQLLREWLRKLEARFRLSGGDRSPFAVDESKPGSPAKSSLCREECAKSGQPSITPSPVLQLRWIDIGDRNVVAPESLMLFATTGG